MNTIDIECLTKNLAVFSKRLGLTEPNKPETIMTCIEFLKIQKMEITSRRSAIFLTMRSFLARQGWTDLKTVTAVSALASTVAWAIMYSESESKSTDFDNPVLDNPDQAKFLYLMQCAISGQAELKEYADDAADMIDILTMNRGKELTNIAVGNILKSKV